MVFCKKDISVILKNIMSSAKFMFIHKYMCIERRYGLGRDTESS